MVWSVKLWTRLHFGGLVRVLAHTHTQHKPEINILVNLDVQIVAFHVVSIRRSLIQLSIAQPSLSFRLERKKKKLYPTNPPSAISQLLLHRVFFFAQIPFSPCTYPSPGWHVLGIFFIPLKNFAIFVTKKTHTTQPLVSDSFSKKAPKSSSCCAPGSEGLCCALLLREDFVALMPLFEQMSLGRL